MSKAFWDYVKTSNKVSSLESAFEDWVNKDKLNIEIAKEAWISINKDIRDRFAISPIVGPPSTPAAPGALSTNVSVPAAVPTGLQTGLESEPIEEKPESNIVTDMLVN